MNVWHSVEKESDGARLFVFQRQKFQLKHKDRHAVVRERPPRDPLPCRVPSARRCPRPRKHLSLAPMRSSSPLCSYECIDLML